MLKEESTITINNGTRVQPTTQETLPTATAVATAATATAVAKTGSSSHLADGVGDVAPGHGELPADVLHREHLALQLAQATFEAVEYRIHLTGGGLEPRQPRSQSFHSRRERRSVHYFLLRAHGGKLGVCVLCVFCLFSVQFVPSHKKRGRFCPLSSGVY